MACAGASAVRLWHSGRGLYGELVELGICVSKALCNEGRSLQKALACHLQWRTYGGVRRERYLDERKVDSYSSQGTDLNHPRSTWCSRELFGIFTISDGRRRKEEEMHAEPATSLPRAIRRSATSTIKLPHKKDIRVVDGINTSQWTGRLPVHHGKQMWGRIVTSAYHLVIPA